MELIESLALRHMQIYIISLPSNFEIAGSRHQYSGYARKIRHQLQSNLTKMTNGSTRAGEAAAFNNAF